MFRFGAVYYEWIKWTTLPSLILGERAKFYHHLFHFIRHHFVCPKKEHFLKDLDKFHQASSVFRQSLRNNFVLEKYYSGVVFRPLLNIQDGVFVKTING